MDTVGCAAFQGPGGQARSLAALAARLLGRTIQADRHSARCDPTQMHGTGRMFTLRLLVAEGQRHTIVMMSREDVA